MEWRLGQFKNWQLGTEKADLQEKMIEEIDESHAQIWKSPPTIVT